MKTLNNHFASIIMAILIVATLVPATAFADEATATTTPDNIHYAGEHGRPVLVQTGEAVDFQNQGIIKVDEIQFSWCSSKDRPSEKMNEWFKCDDGFWRTADGYIVVASRDNEEGEIVNTPFGEGMVLDYCELENNITIYTHW